MPTYLILCQSKVTALALEAWRNLLGGASLYGAEQVPAPIIFDASLLPEEGGATSYRALAQRIEFAAGPNSSIPRETVVMVDSVTSTKLSAISEKGTWDHLIAMLVLTFPDIRWVFGMILGESTGLRIEDHGLASLLTQPHREPLMDPSGLREWIRSRTNIALKLLKSEFKLPERGEKAAAIDEETDFAFMHAYVTFRYGYRADVVTSWALMASLFGESALRQGGHGYSLILEDMRLNFPDKPAHVHLSRLRIRADHCPCLDLKSDSSEGRFLITTGQTGSEKRIVLENEEYLGLRGKGRSGCLLKPVGGIVDLWAQIGPQTKLPGFRWSPVDLPDELTDGHGSPGKLALVATTLLHRSREVRKQAATVPEFIRGAVLSMEASELLGGKTPMLTMSALALKHEFEVRAECSFLGAGYHFGVQGRLGEVTAEVKAVTRRLSEENREKSTWDGKVSILNPLILAFREAGRLEEEHLCLVALRRLNRRMSRPRKGSPLAWLAHWAMSYGEWLLESFWKIILLPTILVGFLVLLAWWLGSPAPNRLSDATSMAINSFFGGSAATSGSLWLKVISWIGAVIGVFHLGILVSYLYSLIARK